MATNVRTFDTDDYISLDSGGADSGWGTWLSVLKRNADGDANVIRHVTDGSPIFLWYFEVTTHYIVGYFGGGSTTDVAVPSADGWCIAAMSKASGTVAARGHKKVLSTSATSHAAPGTARANAGAGTGWRIGWTSTSLQSDVYCMARWDAQVLSDAAINAIASTQDIIDLTPTNLWILDQASIATAVTDYMETGADQTAINGTSVTAGVTIPNFDTTLPSGVVVATTIPNKMLMGVGL